MRLRTAIIMMIVLSGMVCHTGAAYAVVRNSLPHALEAVALQIGKDLAKSRFRELDHMAIRSVRVSENLPPSYGRFVEAMVVEQIKSHTKMRLITCETCRTRLSNQGAGQLTITNVKNSIKDLDAAAAALGIDFFLDVIAVGDPANVVVTLQVIASRSKDVAWVRAYNGDSAEDHQIHQSRQRRNIAKARVASNYVPDYQFWVAFGVADVPNVAGTVNDRQAFVLHSRMTEQVLDRRGQFGVLGDLVIMRTVTAQPYPSAGDDSAEEVDGAEDDIDDEGKGLPMPFRYAATVVGSYYHTLLGDPQRINRVRGGLNVGAGFLVAQGYFAPLLRSGMDIYFGPRGALSAAALYLMPTTIQVGGETTPTKGGLGAELVLGVYL